MKPDETPDTKEVSRVECDECGDLIEEDLTYVCTHCGDNVCEWCSEYHQKFHDLENDGKEDL